MATDSLKMVCPMHYSDKIENSGVELRKIINWPKGPVKFLNNWPLQNSTGPRNIGPRSGPI